jgi:predicted DCC family thiol-disulfide oxidoreductase YuxK
LTVKSLRDHFLRIDARSLGLFRITFGLVLIADLFARWRWARDFYSNEGVLPNHNHLFNLHGKQEVFSLFHAFSTPGEAHFALAVTLVVYVLFLIGHWTRVFHVLSVVFLVSLTSRNILLENAGNYAAIAILLFTAFLPCGSRFSLDSLRASLQLRDEHRDEELNDRAPLPEAVVAANRVPGWSPATLAALGVLLQIATLYLCSALRQQGDAWRDGSALHYALHVDRWVSAAGGRVRDALPAGALRALTHAFRTTELAIPALLVIPAFYRWTRGAAAALVFVHGLFLGVLFDFGLFGWALAAAAPLLIPVELWDGFERSYREPRARTVIYDADCGVCLWIARLLQRADLRRQLTFQGNVDLGELLTRGADGPVERRPMPAEVTEELTSRTVVVVARDGRVFTRGRAVVEVLRALPLGWLSAPLLLPGLSHALDALYDVVAARRQQISVYMGKQACGVPLPEGDEAAGAPTPDALPTTAPPAVRVARLLTGGVREAAALVVVAAMLAQTAKENPGARMPMIPQGKLLAGVAAWPRMLARWDLLAPEPPRKNSMMVIDGQTRASVPIDPLTGVAPQPDLASRGSFRMGQLWSDYLARVADKQYSDFQRAFREYLSKGGPLSTGSPGDVQIAGFDAYWVTQTIPPPGGGSAGEVEREKLFSQSRGGTGKLNFDMDKPSLPRPILPKLQ